MTAHVDQVLRMLARQDDYWHDRDVIRSVTGLWSGHVDAALAQLVASKQIRAKLAPGRDGRGVELVYTVPLRGQA